MLSDYIKTESLFVGAYAQIWRAQRSADGTPVIIKQLRDTELTTVRITRLRHEHAILTALERARVRGVPVPVEFSEQGGQFALITRDAGGLSLSALRRQSGLSERVVLSVGAQLARVLIDVHAAQVTHKDINPRNVVHNPATNETQLIDFGMAAQMDRGAGVSTGGALEGTLTHMAPEQTGRLGVGMDHRADLYGLGALLYDLLTGRPPVQQGDSTQMIYEILAGSPPAPRKLAPGMAPALEQVLLKLLEKDPHARYRSAYGVYRDLDRCAQALAKRGAIEAFAPGQHDRSETLEWPQALQGRDAELQALEEACQLLPSKQPRVVLVTGGEGMGKTCLLAALRDAALRRRALSVIGAYEAHRQAMNLHGLADALGDLVRQVLTGTVDRVEAWRRRVHGALGNSGQVAVEMVPALLGLVGEQPSVVSLGPTEVQNRLLGVLERWIVATSAHTPLVLCLDNLHLADALTVRLLAQLSVAGGEPRALTLVLAYDPAQVPATSPLGIWLTALQGRSREALRTVGLVPLTPEAVSRWLAVTMGSHDSGGQVSALAGAVHRQTGGAPHAVRAFVQGLWQKQIVRFDTLAGSWHWDVSQVLQQPVTANLVEALKGAVALLPGESGALLAAAACIGTVFEIATLSALTGRDLPSLSAALQPAMGAGILVALDTPGALRFSHEAVREAAEAPITAVERAGCHDRLAQRMLREAPALASTSWLCQVADHVSMAWQQGALTIPIGDAAKVVCQASWRMYDTLSFATAAVYADLGLALLGDTAFGEHRGTGSLLSFMQLRANLAGGQHEAAQKALRSEIQHAATPRERAHAVWRYGYVLRLSGRHEEAIQTLIEALALLGEHVPANPTLVMVMWQQIRFWWSLKRRGRSVESLVNAPSIADERQIALWIPLRDLLTPAAIVRPLLTLWAALRLARLSVEHGVQPANASAYASMLTVASMRGDFAEAGRWVAVMRGLVERAKANPSAYTGTSLVVDGDYVEFYVILQYDSMLQHAQWVIDSYERVAKVMAERGDVATASLAYYGLVWTMTCVSLDRAIAMCAKLESTTTIKTAPNALLQVRAISTVCTLMQGTAQVSGAQRALMAEATLDVTVREVALGQFALQALLHLIMRNLRAAVDCLWQSGMDRLVPQTLLTRLNVSPVVCLVCTQYAFAHGNAMPRRLRKTFHRHIKQLRRTSRLPGCRVAGVVTGLDAEVAALDGRMDQASRLHDKAGLQVLRSATTSSQASMWEAAGRFHARGNRRTLAACYLRRACDAYRAWGSPYKARELAREFALWTEGDEKSTEMGAQSISTSVQAEAGEQDALIAHLQGIHRRLAGEFNTGRLMAQIAAMAGEAAPGCRMVLALRGPEDNDALRVRSDSAAEGTPLPDFVFEQAQALAVRVVANVALDAAASVHPYFAGWESGFYVLVPIAHRGQLRGLLYCESGDSFDFAMSTVTRLSLLAGQAAVALENAAVYNTLEAEVEARTREAREAERRLHHIALSDAEVQMSNGFAAEVCAALDASLEARRALRGAAATPAAHARMGGALDRAAASLAQGPEQAVTALRGELRELQAELTDTLMGVDRSMERAMDLTGQVLGYAEASRLVAGDHSVPLDALLPTVLRELAAGFQDARIALDLDVSPGLRLPLREEHARVILGNLLTNACDAVRGQAEGGPAPRRVVLHAHRAQGQIDVSVEDSGVGMNEAVQARVFQPFFSTKGAAGTGLSLGLSRKLARLYGGELAFSSEEGRGSTFTFTLPARE